MTNVLYHYILGEYDIEFTNDTNEPAKIQGNLQILQNFVDKHFI